MIIKQGENKSLIWILLKETSGTKFDPTSFLQSVQSRLILRLLLSFTVPELLNRFVWFFFSFFSTKFIDENKGICESFHSLDGICPDLAHLMQKGKQKCTKQQQECWILRLDGKINHYGMQRWQVLKNSKKWRLVVENEKLTEAPKLTLMYIYFIRPT